MVHDAARVLLVEDDTPLREAVAAALRGDGYDVLSLPDGTEVVTKAATFRPDVAVLDVRLPVGPTGLSLARVLREDQDLPVLMLTAADGVDDRLAGFAVGPMITSSGRSRCRSCWRASARCCAAPDGSPRARGWSATSSSTRPAAAPIEVTQRWISPERSSTCCSSSTATATGSFSKSQLLAAVWGFDASDPNLVEVHVSALRRKLERHGPGMIHTVRGVGYRLQA